jgi:hypothetical protein
VPQALPDAFGVESLLELDFDSDSLEDEAAPLFLPEPVEEPDE